MRFVSLTLAALATGSMLYAGENWPQFRGPDANGHSDVRNLPLEWSADKGVVWKTPIHDRGWSSPVVWKDQIWLTTATTNGKKLFAMCVNRDSGKVIHDIHVFDVEKPERIAGLNSYASPTGAIEEGRVYVHFGNAGTACIDTASGRILWERRDLTCDYRGEGSGSSVTLVDNLLVFNVDGCDVQYVVALDKTTGKTAWKTDRSADFKNVGPNLRKSYSTPIIAKVGDQRQLISVGPRATMGYDIPTGKEIWKVTYGGWSIAPRPIFHDGILYMINAYINPELWAVRADGQGDVTSTHILWKNSKSMPSRPSPIRVDDLLYVVSSEGIASCIQANTGELVWKERLGSKFSASPIHVAGRVYFFDESSVTSVIEPGRQFKLLATNTLGSEALMASPAVVDNSLIIRTAGHLYRIAP